MTNLLQKTDDREAQYLMSSHLSKAALTISLFIGFLIGLKWADTHLTGGEVFGALSASILLGYVVPMLHAIRENQMINRSKKSSNE